jgi:hypothetical protein
MIVGNAERAKYEAHVELASRSGFSSVMPLQIETTFYVPHSGLGTFASVVEVPVSIEVSVSIMAEGRGIQRLGEVSWRDYTGYSDPFRTTTYYKIEGDVPRLMISPSVGFEGHTAHSARDPFTVAKSLVDQCASKVREIAEPTASRTKTAIMKFAETYIRNGMDATRVVVDHAGTVTMLKHADVPNYVVVPQAGKPPIDAARWDVEVSRPTDFETLNWRGLGLRFEPWEADIAGRMMAAYGVKRGWDIPAAIKFPEDAAYDLAVINRCAIHSFLPIYIKKVMLDISGSDLGRDQLVQVYTSAAYSAVAKGEWGSHDLDAALDGLHELWRRDQKFRDFCQSRGWDLNVSPFEIIKARVERFPWQGLSPDVVDRAAPSFR